MTAVLAPIAGAPGKVPKLSLGLRAAVGAAALAIATGALVAASSGNVAAEWSDRARGAVAQPASDAAATTTLRLNAAATMLMSHVSVRPAVDRHRKANDLAAPPLGASIVSAPLGDRNNSPRTDPAPATAGAVPAIASDVKREPAPGQRAATVAAAPRQRTGRRAAITTPVPRPRPSAPSTRLAGDDPLPAGRLVSGSAPAPAPQRAKARPVLDVRSIAAAPSDIAPGAVPPAATPPPAEAASEPLSGTGNTVGPRHGIFPEVFGVAPALAEAAPPGPPPVPSQSEIVRAVRTLSALQDDIAAGSGAALTAQAVLMRTIAETFSAADPRVWGEAHNARSLALYALSGGSPGVVRRVVSLETLDPTFEPMVSGALAYLEGRREDAKRHFAGVHPDTLDPSLRGPFFLAMAALRVEGDTAAARRDLDAARLAAPGSLVEEAALRRAILIAAETDDVDGFSTLVNRYLRRFRGSIYAGNFRRRLSAAITRMTFVREPDAVRRLDEILAPMTEAGRQELYLLVSRAAVENGDRNAASLAAERAAETAPAGTLGATRARLYRAAALVVEPNEVDAALETLRDLEATALPADDAALLTAALELGQAVTELPAAAPVEPPSGDAPATGGTPVPIDAVEPDASAPDEAIVAAVEARASAILQSVDLLLQRTSGTLP